MASRAWGQLSTKLVETTWARSLDESAARDGFFGEVVESGLHVAARDIQRHICTRTDGKTIGGIMIPA